ncbi:MAG: PepSY-like domain-containing protein [Saprospiraceae bacterium]|nr:PepSY-like domain-containing protein [Lewinella sp.]
MKKRILISGLIALIGLAGMSFLLRDPEVPQVVLDAFAAKFPHVKKVKWEKEADNEYEAEFKQGGHEMSANFDSDGTWLETEVEMKKAELPDAVKKAIQREFSGYDIEEAERVETPDLPLAFEVELENEADNTEVEAVFSADGKLLKKKMEKESEEDDEDKGN